MGMTRDEAAATHRLNAEEKMRVFRNTAGLLASSLNFDETLAHVIDACLPALGDFGFFDVVTAEGVRRTSRAYCDPATEAILKPARWMPQEQSGMNLCALTTGKAALHTEIDDDWYRKAAADEGHLAVLRLLAFRSMITVPLRYHDELLGALTLFMARSDRRFDESDLAFAQELAMLAAPVVVNVGLLERQRAAKAEAESANRAKDAFLAMLGHELRNPLAPIVTALQLMELRGDTSTRYEQAVIARQVDHLSRLVGDLLDISRISQGKVELCMERIDIRSVIEKAMELALPLLERNSLAVDVALPSVPIHVNGDAVRLTQVFGNLLSNAAKFTQEQGNVRLQAGTDGGEAVVSVADDGTGIAPDLLPHVFDLFVQAPQRIDRRAGGLGLGLTIARTFVGLHGGTISAHSEGAGKGSRFEVRLPLSAENKLPLAPADAAPVTVARVLVVDDNIDAGETVTILLEANGCEVRFVPDGETALRIAPGFKPDIAILDIGLPGMDGYELAKHLKADASLAGIRLIALSGYSCDSRTDQEAGAGFDCRLVKPVRSKELLVRIRELAHAI